MTAVDEWKQAQIKAAFDADPRLKEEAVALHYVAVASLAWQMKKLTELRWSYASAGAETTHADAAIKGLYEDINRHRQETLGEPVIQSKDRRQEG